MLALLALQPEYASVVQPFIGWAAAPLIGNMTSIIKDLAFLLPEIQLVGGEFAFSTPIVSYLVQALCLPILPIGSQILCPFAFEQLFGDTDSLNDTRIDEYFNYLPSGVSDWDMAHYGQLYETDSFIRYNYGSDAANLAAYNQTTPPLYPIENIPDNYTIVLINGATDALVVPGDAQILVEKLQAVGANVIHYIVPNDEWNHLDFIIGEGAGRLLNDKTLAYLDLYTLNN